MVTRSMINLPEPSTRTSISLALLNPFWLAGHLQNAFVGVLCAGTSGDRGSPVLAGVKSPLHSLCPGSEPQTTGQAKRVTGSGTNGTVRFRTRPSENGQTRRSLAAAVSH